MTDGRIDEATRRYDSGEFQTAIEMLLEVIDSWPPDAPPGERQRAQLYLAAMYRQRGERHTALELLRNLEKETALDSFLQAHVFLALSRIHLALGDQKVCLEYLEHAEGMIDFRIDSEAGTDPVYQICCFHNSFGRYYLETGDQRKAIKQFLQARDRAVSIENRILVTIYINLANSHAILGEREIARDYLSLAFATLKNIDRPYVHGLVHYFETLASFNLFVYDSKEKAIDCLSRISEKMIDNFDDFKRVFDFFGEVLVQSHEGKFDLDKLKKVKDYYNDPLIQAYLPSLIAGAPRPGEEVGKDQENE